MSVPANDPSSRKVRRLRIDFLLSHLQPDLLVISQTTSGSATWNDFVMATFARNIPFGGVGASGWGSYHGKDGFNAFTHHKGQPF